MGSARSLPEEVVNALLALARALNEACTEAKSLLRALSVTGKEGSQILWGSTGDNGVR